LLASASLLSPGRERFSHAHASSWTDRSARPQRGHCVSPCASVCPLAALSPFRPSSPPPWPGKRGGLSSLPPRQLPRVLRFGAPLGAFYSERLQCAYEAPLAGNPLRFARPFSSLRSFLGPLI